MLLLSSFQLRDIEVLISERLTAHESGEPLPEDALSEEALLKQMQAILYSTEEGFELPDGGEVIIIDGQDYHGPQSTDTLLPRLLFSQAVVNEEETF